MWCACRSRWRFAVSASTPAGNDRGESDGKLGPPVRPGLAGYGERPRTATTACTCSVTTTWEIVPVPVSVTRPVRVSLTDVEYVPEEATCTVR
jgi:hypothetical protein